MKPEHPPADAIVIRGARQNNLKNLTLTLPAGELIVVTGVSGSGKSSLVFDTLYAEGQRRYVETFSPYARQFLERMDKPQVDAVEGIPPAIAIDQTNPVRTSRSTVGTMTELNDHLKLLYARAAKLHCRQCGQPVRRDTPESIYQALPQDKVTLTFPVPVPKNFSEKEIEELLQRQGYTKLHSRSKHLIEVVQDTVTPGKTEQSRVMDGIESALRFGQGKLTAYLNGDSPHFFSTSLHCATCNLGYADPTPAMFSFNSPLGACDTCRGFGRVIGVDYGLVIPDEAKSLREGAIRPWQTPSFKECQDDLAKYAKKHGVAMDVAWRDLPPEHRQWVLDGDDGWVSWKKSWPGKWYGVGRFFKWLESKAYKMHIRVLLSKYRAYTECPACGGTRLKPDATLWKIEGKSIHELMLMPVSDVQRLFGALALPKPMDEATELLLGEIRTRLAYLGEVGLGYLTLDRQSRTLSGGEVQRINLTTALGTSLVNTLFVLDEPSIGLHPRDMGRVIDVMKKLRDAGNSLVVVEHDPQIMFAADRILDMGPGPGERGGEIVYFGDAAALRGEDTLTAQYLSGRKRAEAPRTPRAPEKFLRVEGAAEHNLKGDRGVGLGQVHAGAGRALRGAAQGEGQADGNARQAPGAARRRAGRRGRPGGPIADRQDHALQSGELRRRLRRDPRLVREGAPVQGAPVHAGHLQLQLRQRALPGLRRQRLRARRNAVPVRRLPALPGLRRQALPGRSSGSEAARQEHRRCAGDDRVGGGRILQGRRRRPRHAAAPGRRRPGLPASRAAGADALGRRSAAPEAGRAPGRPIGVGTQAVPVRRADDRPALRGHRQAAARLPAAAAGRPLAAGDRAQPRRDPRRRLDPRPRPRRRRRRRRAGGRRHARRRDAPPHLAHRQGAP